MWWPSFKEVVHDLWRFCTQRSYVAAPAVAVEPQLPSYRVQSVAPTPVVSVRLRPGQTYTADHADTVRMRERLSAYDSNIITTGPLTTYEWLLYSLQDKRLAVPLLALRLTPLGRWHTTLKGQPGVSIGVTPYTDALIEWRQDGIDQVGWLCEVTPDETIVVGQLGQSAAGVYQTQSLTKQQWRELRPIFTSFV